MKLAGKVIYIISYESWGHMLMSKHHYAIELGKAGNEVYFINHPDKRKELKRRRVNVKQTNSLNVWAVSHRLFSPYFIKFKINWLYNFFVAAHIRRIVRTIGKNPDIVWSFDTGNTLPLKYFPETALKIFMPVDGPFGHIHEKHTAGDADVIISVTDRILKAYDNFQKPKLLVNHGVAEVFLDSPRVDENDDKIRIGYSGSLIRNDLDIDCFLKIINGHPDKIFEFWGEHDFRRSNIHLPQDVSERTLKFLDILHTLPNVIMNGPVTSEFLALGLNRMDCLLICYSIKNDQNHHKVLEYLGTGKVIVSNYLSSYACEDSGLMVMPRDPQSNAELPGLFDGVITNLKHHNSPEKIEMRKRYARKFSYSNNISRIEDFLNANVKRAAAERA